MWAFQQYAYFAQGKLWLCLFSVKNLNLISLEIVDFH